MNDNNLKLAVLIDADNVSYKYLKALFDEVAQYGIACVKRVYGDWSSTLLSPWKNEALLHSIIPIQQFSYTTGKNSTDSAMIIDAMDILYSSDVEGFCLVSSDSDFTRLASRLRESGKLVIGFGESKTPQSFRTACNKFICLDLINTSSVTEVGNTASTTKKGVKRTKVEKTTSATETSSASPSKIPSEVVELLRKIVEENSVEAERWVFLAKVGGVVNRYKSDFDYRAYGAKSLSDLFEMLGDQFEIQIRDTSNPNIKHYFVRCKQ